MEIPEDNEWLHDLFMYQIDLAIENGDPSIIQNAIKIYKGSIPESYIEMAERQFNQLVLEQLENMELS